ncbi:AraC family transcriptional regulator [Natronospora cellulosivora (SeqCode)]
MECVRIYEILACKMVSSQCGMFGDGKLERFDEWFSALPKTMFPRDFLWYDSERGGFVWYYMYSEGMEVPEEFNIVDFPGGLYAVTTDIDGQDNSEAKSAIKKFIKEKDCFEEDTSREELGNIPTPPSASKAMGYSQMDYYVPIKII